MTLRNALVCFGVTSSVLLSSIFAPSNGWAGGKSKPTYPTPSPSPCDFRSSQACAPIQHDPNPLRDVVLQPVGTMPFRLPNGTLVDLTANLQSLMQTSVGTTGVFLPRDPSRDYPCNTHLELRSAISILALNVAEFGITFGYSPAGAIPIAGPTLTGSANVKVGTIAMDFGLNRCSNGACEEAIASTSDHLTSGVNLNFQMDMQVIQTGATLVYNTELGNVIRKIMENGVGKIAKSREMDLLPWQAEVKDYSAQTGVLIFNAGVQSRIKMNQTFEVYAAPTSSTPGAACDIYKLIAYVHTTQVGAVASRAVVDQIFDTRGIFPGDIVMIRSLANASYFKNSVRK